jgi:2-keto-4-pentenoate hydratase/2-oxohepta-3-ene-1,7-dioic acid hydratase in catechol pathway
VQETAIDLMLFNVETLISYISAFTELRAGDVIATGTCGGVGEKRVPPLWMVPGDVVEVEISGLPILRNPVVAEA